MKILRKIFITLLIAALALSFSSCDKNKGAKFDDGVFAEDSSAELNGTAETGGAISFISRVGAYDLNAPSHAVIRVKLQNEFDYCKLQNLTVPADKVKYSNGKLAIHRDFFTENFERHFSLDLTVYDKSGNSGVIPFVIADKIIYNETEFQQINTNSAALQGYYVLANDLDFSGKNYTMLGCITDNGRDQTDNPFRGVFEGAGHTISNISVNKWNRMDIDDPSGFMVGVFKVVGPGGVVRNLSLKNIKIEAGGGIAGGLCGINSGTIENCYVEGSVIPHAWNEPSGGLCGFNVAGATIKNSVSYCAVEGLSFCGANFGKIENCYAVEKSGGRLCALGGYLHAGVELPPYDVGFEVKNQFACDMFEGETANSKLLSNVSELNNSANFGAFNKLYWNTNGAVKLYKMFLNNPQA